MGIWSSFNSHLAMGAGGRVPFLVTVLEHRVSVTGLGSPMASQRAEEIQNREQAAGRQMGMVCSLTFVSWAEPRLAECLWIVCLPKGKEVFISLCLWSVATKIHFLAAVSLLLQYLDHRNNETVFQTLEIQHEIPALLSTVWRSH